MDPVAKPSRFSVGLTGGIGSGKSTVATMFEQRGAQIIDTDSIAHQLTAPNGLAIPQIEAIFGSSFIATNGAMDRDAMRNEVFTNPSAKKTLENILHPLIRSESERLADSMSGPYPIFVVPLLVESGTWKNRVSRVLVVDSSEAVQIRRVMQRNNFTEQQIRAIMQTQVSRATRLAAADDVVLNEADTEALTPQVDELHRQYLQLAQAG